MEREEMLDNIMEQLMKNNIIDRAVCLTVLARIKTEKQYQQMMEYLTQNKNLEKEEVANKAIEISKTIY